jgi:hypothetical protein
MGRSSKAVAERKAARALELSLAGATPTQIAREVGFKHPQSAFRVVQSELRKRRMTTQNIDELLTLQLERCNRMLLLYWPDVQKKDMEATRLSLEIMRRIDQYAGITGTSISFAGEGGSTGMQQNISGGATFIIGGAPDDYLKSLNGMAAELGLPPAADLAHLEGRGPMYDGSTMTGKEFIDAQVIDETGLLIAPQNAPETPLGHLLAPDSPEALNGHTNGHSAAGSPAVECPFFVRPVSGEDACAQPGCGKPKAAH